MNRYEITKLYKYLHTSKPRNNMVGIDMCIRQMALHKSNNISALQTLDNEPNANRAELEETINTNEELYEKFYKTLKNDITTKDTKKVVDFLNILSKKNEEKLSKNKNTTYISESEKASLPKLKIDEIREKQVLMATKQVLGIVKAYASNLEKSKQ